MSKKASYLPRGQRLMNALFVTLVRLGWIPGHIIRVPGRKSGEMQTIPLYVLRYQGQRWLVAGYAQSDWVKNVRAAGWCELFHDHVKERVKVIEEGNVEIQADVLQAFVNLAPGAKRAYT
jgi:hypothetical protein